MKKIIFIIVIGIFLVNISGVDLLSADNLPHDTSYLSTAAITDRPYAYREHIADLYKANRMIWIADPKKPESRYNRLLDRHSANAMLLSSGRYLMTPQVANDYLSLIRAVTYSDYIVLMQKKEKKASKGYEALMKKVLKNEKIKSLYSQITNNRNIAQDMRSVSKRENKNVFNAIIAKAFELYFIVENRLVYPQTELLPEEREFLALMCPILTLKDGAGRYRNFSRVFLIYING